MIVNEEIEELKILTFRNLNNYEKLEVERLKNKINEIIKAINILNKNKAQNTKQPTIFIDTQDMEERYGEQLYQDYLVEQNKDLKQENARLKEIENKLNFIKNRVKQGMSQENINKCAIELVNSYLKDILKEDE